MDGMDGMNFNCCYENTANLFHKISKLFYIYLLRGKNNIMADNTSIQLTCIDEAPANRHLNISYLE